MTRTCTYVVGRHREDVLLEEVVIGQTGSWASVVQDRAPARVSRVKHLAVLGLGAGRECSPDPQIWLAAGAVKADIQGQAIALGS